VILKKNKKNPIYGILGKEIIKILKILIKISH